MMLTLQPLENLLKTLPAVDPSVIELKSAIDDKVNAGARLKAWLKQYQKEAAKKPFLTPVARALAYQIALDEVGAGQYNRFAITRTLQLLHQVDNPLKRYPGEIRKDRQVDQLLSGDYQVFGTFQHAIIIPWPHANYKKDEATLPPLRGISDLPAARETLEQYANTHQDPRTTEVLKEVRNMKEPVNAESIKQFLTALKLNADKSGFTGDPHSPVNALCAQLAWLTIDKQTDAPMKEFWNTLYPGIKLNDFNDNSSWPAYGQAILDHKNKQLLHYGKLYALAHKPDGYQTLIKMLSLDVLKRVESFYPGHADFWKQARQELNIIARDPNVLAHYDKLYALAQQREGYLNLVEMLSPEVMNTVKTFKEAHAEFWKKMELNTQDEFRLREKLKNCENYWQFFECLCNDLLKTYRVGNGGSGSSDTNIASTGYDYLARLYQPYLLKLTHHVDALTVKDREKFEINTTAKKVGDMGSVNVMSIVNILLNPPSSADSSYASCFERNYGYLNSMLTKDPYAQNKAWLNLNRALSAITLPLDAYDEDDLLDSGTDDIVADPLNVNEVKSLDRNQLIEAIEKLSDTANMEQYVDAYWHMADGQVNKIKHFFDFAMSIKDKDPNNRSRFIKAALGKPLDFSLLFPSIADHYEKYATTLANQLFDSDEDRSEFHIKTLINKGLIKAFEQGKAIIPITMISDDLSLITKIKNKEHSEESSGFSFDIFLNILKRQDITAEMQGQLMSFYRTDIKKGFNSANIEHIHTIYNTVMNKDDKDRYFDLLKESLPSLLTETKIIKEFLQKIPDKRKEIIDAVKKEEWLLDGEYLSRSNDNVRSWNQFNNYWKMWYDLNGLFIHFDHHKEEGYELVKSKLLGILLNSDVSDCIMYFEQAASTFPRDSFIKDFIESFANHSKKIPQKLMLHLLENMDDQGNYQAYRPLLFKEIELRGNTSELTPDQPTPMLEWTDLFKFPMNEEETSALLKYYDSNLKKSTANQLLTIVKNSKYPTLCLSTIKDTVFDAITSISDFRCLTELNASAGLELINSYKDGSKKAPLNVLMNLDEKTAAEIISNQSLNFTAFKESISKIISIDILLDRFKIENNKNIKPAKDLVRLFPNNANDLFTLAKECFSADLKNMSHYGATYPLDSLLGLYINLPFDKNRSDEMFTIITDNKLGALYLLNFFHMDQIVTFFPNHAEQIDRLLSEEIKNIKADFLYQSRITTAYNREPDLIVSLIKSILSTLTPNQISACLKVFSKKHFNELIGDNNAVHDQAFNQFCEHFMNTYFHPKGINFEGSEDAFYKIYDLFMRLPHTTERSDGMWELIDKVKNVTSIPIAFVYFLSKYTYTELLERFPTHGEDIISILRSEIPINSHDRILYPQSQAQYPLIAAYNRNPDFLFDVMFPIDPSNNQIKDIINKNDVIEFLSTEHARKIIPADTNQLITLFNEGNNAAKAAYLANCSQEQVKGLFECLSIKKKSYRTDMHHHIDVNDSFKGDLARKELYYSFILSECFDNLTDMILKINSPRDRSLTFVNGQYYHATHMEAFIKLLRAVTSEGVVTRFLEKCLEKLELTHAIFTLLSSVDATSKSSHSETSAEFDSIVCDISKISTEKETVARVDMFIDLLVKGNPLLMQAWSYACMPDQSLLPMAVYRACLEMKPRSSESSSTGQPVLHSFASQQEDMKLMDEVNKAIGTAVKTVNSKNGKQDIG